MQNVYKVAISSDSLIGHLPFRRHCLKDHDLAGQLTHTKLNQIITIKLKYSKITSTDDRTECPLDFK